MALRSTWRRLARGASAPVAHRKEVYEVDCLKGKHMNIYEKIVLDKFGKVPNKMLKAVEELLKENVRHYRSL